VKEDYPGLPEDQDPDRAISDDPVSAQMWKELAATCVSGEAVSSGDAPEVTPTGAAIATIESFYFGDYVYTQRERRQHILLPESDGSNELTHHLYGEVPDSAAVMLKNLYELLDAKIKRNDHTKGAARGVVVREGRYHVLREGGYLEERVYIAELFVDGERMYGDPDKSKLEVLIVDEAAAKDWLGESSSV